MPQPTPFNRSFNFSDFQANNPSSPPPGPSLDGEFDNAAKTLGDILANLILLQRDDGKLVNEIVDLDAIAQSVLYAIAAAVVTAQTPENPRLSFQITALAPGAFATAEVTGTYPDLVISLGIPKGDAAEPGAATLADGDYGDVQVSGGGSHMSVSRIEGTAPFSPANKPTFADIDARPTTLAGFGITDALPASGGVGDFTTPAGGHAIRIRPEPTNVEAVVEVTDTAGAVQWGHWSYTPGGFANWIGVGGLLVNGQSVIPPVLSVNGKTGAAVLTAADIGAPTTAQLAAKADALTTVKSFAANQAVSDAAHNGCYNRLTGAAGLTVTFGAPSAGHCAIWVNRGSVGMTIKCAGGYFKNGAGVSATADLTLAPGGKLTAFHEGGGVWTFDGVGF